MNKQIGLTIMIISLVFIFAGHSVAPAWFINSTLGDIIFTLVSLLGIIGIIMMIK